jgi:hypothetical protein
MADPKGGVRAEAPTTIRYNGTAVFMAFTPVCLAANIPLPLSNPCFLIVGISLAPVLRGDVLRLVIFLAGITKPVLPDN